MVTEIEILCKKSWGKDARSRVQDSNILLFMRSGLHILCNEHNDVELQFMYPAVDLTLEDTWFHLYIQLCITPSECAVWGSQSISSAYAEEPVVAGKCTLKEIPSARHAFYDDFTFAFLEIACRRLMF